MSDYGEIDEAQYRHYNYGPSHDPEQSYPPHNTYTDTSPPPQQSYSSHNTYTSPLPQQFYPSRNTDTSPPHALFSPDPTTFTPSPPWLSASSTASSIYPGPSANPASVYYPTNLDDTGQSFLPRDASESAWISVDNARSDIRSGRIPQRVLKRYKTLKKVEYVFSFFAIAIKKHWQALPWQLCSRQCRP